MGSRCASRWWTCRWVGAGSGAVVAAEAPGWGGPKRTQWGGGCACQLGGVCLSVGRYSRLAAAPLSGAAALRDAEAGREVLADDGAAAAAGRGGGGPARLDVRALPPRRLGRQAGSSAGDVLSVCLISSGRPARPRALAAFDRYAGVVSADQQQSLGCRVLFHAHTLVAAAIT